MNRRAKCNTQRYFQSVRKGKRADNFLSLPCPSFIWSSAIVLAIGVGVIMGSSPGFSHANVGDRGATNPSVAEAPPVLSSSNKLINLRYGRLPLSFEANQGQTDSQVKFLSRGRGYSLFLTPKEAVLVLRKGSGVSSQQSAKGDKLSAVSSQLSARNLNNPKSQVQNRKPKIENPKSPKGQNPAIKNPKSQIQNRQSVVLRMQLIDADPAPEVIGLEELSGKVNYLIGNDPKKWHTNVPTYARVEYRDVYPGVKLVYYGNQRQLEYDFVVSSGADPRAIRLALVGAEKLEVDAQGDLIAHTPGGQVRFKKPFVYQQVNGTKKEIVGNYVLLSPKTRNSALGTEDSPLETQNWGLTIHDSRFTTPHVGFQVAAYDTNKPLIIDPELVYSTYLGGRDDDKGFGIAVDSDGNAYVTGQTSSRDFPSTLGAFDRKRGGSTDAFVTKLKADGSLDYSTFLGGG